MTTHVSDPDDVRWLLRSKSFAPIRPESGHGAEYVALLTRNSLADLYGDDHFERRRILSALFSRSLLGEYEDDHLVPSLRSTLARTAVGASPESPVRVDLLVLCRRIFLRLMVRLVGLDGLDDDEAFDDFHDDFVAMERLARAKFVDDPARLTAEALAAQERMVEQHFRPSWERHRQLLDQVDRGELSPESIPTNLITLMLSHPEHYDRWDHGLPGREATLFMNASVGSTAGAICDAVHDLERWLPADSAHRHLLDNRAVLRQSFEESLRVNQSNVLLRTALDDVSLPSGDQIHEGDVAIVDRENANRSSWSAEHEYVPGHDTEPGTGSRFGLAFGAGAHTCIARPVVLGMAAGSQGAEAGRDGLGVTTLHELFRYGISLDTAHPPKRWEDMSRKTWRTFPVTISGLA